MWTKVERFLCKIQIHENAFYKGSARLCFTKTKIVTNRVDGIKFSKDVNISMWNLPTFNDTLTIWWWKFHLLSRFEGKNYWKFQYFLKWILKFYKLGNFFYTNQNSSWKPDSEGKFRRVFRFFSAIARNPTRGVSWSRVIRFLILDFSIGFWIFLKFSPKMLYLGPIYPRKVGHIDTS